MIQLGAQFESLLNTETCPRSTCIKQATLIVDAQHQGTEAGKPFLRGQVSGNNKLLPLKALRFQPAVTASGLVNGIGQFRDNSFDPMLAGLFEKLRSTPDDVIAVAQRTTFGNGFE